MCERKTWRAAYMNALRVGMLLPKALCFGHSHPYHKEHRSFGYSDMKFGYVMKCTPQVSDMRNKLGKKFAFYSETSKCNLLKTPIFSAPQSRLVIFNHADICNQKCQSMSGFIGKLRTWQLHFDI